jgi:hypothetical protein
MLHLADEINRKATNGVPYGIGEWAAEQAIGNYREEAEEDDAADADRFALEIAKAA